MKTCKRNAPPPKKKKKKKKKNYNNDTDRQTGRDRDKRTVTQAGRHIVTRTDL